MNRFDIVKDLMMEKAGATFVQAVASMYVKTYYVPKTSNTTTGEPILAQHGVTQGRNSIFNFNISANHTCVHYMPSPKGQKINKIM